MIYQAPETQSLQYKGQIQIRTHQLPSKTYYLMAMGTGQSWLLGPGNHGDKATIKKLLRQGHHCFLSSMEIYVLGTSLRFSLVFRLCRTDWPGRDAGPFTGVLCLPPGFPGSLAAVVLFCFVSSSCRPLKLHLN